MTPRGACKWVCWQPLLGDLPWLHAADLPFCPPRPAECGRCQAPQTGGGVVQHGLLPFKVGLADIPPTCHISCALLNILKLWERNHHMICCRLECSPSRLTDLPLLLCPAERGPGLVLEAMGRAVPHGVGAWGTGGHRALHLTSPTAGGARLPGGWRSRGLHGGYSPVCRLRGWGLLCGEDASKPATPPPRTALLVPTVMAESRFLLPAGTMIPCWDYRCPVLLAALQRAQVFRRCLLW